MCSTFWDVDEDIHETFDYGNIPMCFSATCCSDVHVTSEYVWKIVWPNSNVTT